MLWRPNASASILPELLTRIYAERGITYKAMIESHVRQEPRLGNAQFVLGYRGVDPEAATEIALVGALSQGSQHPVGSLEQQLKDCSDVRAAIFVMATRKQVRLISGPGTSQS